MFAVFCPLSSWGGQRHKKEHFFCKMLCTRGTFILYFLSFLLEVLRFAERLIVKKVGLNMISGILCLSKVIIKRVQPCFSFFHSLAIFK